MAKQNALNHPKAKESAAITARHSATTVQAVKLALACTLLANRGTIDTSPKGLGLKNPVFEDTFGQAVAALAEKKGFVSPKFWELVRLHGFHMVYGGMGHTVRLAAWLVPCLQHPVHLLRVKTQLMIPKSRQGATMSASLGHSAPTTPKATPAIPTATEAQAFAILEATSNATLAAFYLRKGNVKAARRKAVQLLKSLQVLEVAHA